MAQHAEDGSSAAGQTYFNYSCTVLYTVLDLLRDRSLARPPGAYYTPWVTAEAKQ